MARSTPAVVGVAPQQVGKGDDHRQPLCSYRLDSERAEVGSSPRGFFVAEPGRAPEYLSMY
jgi:hypothetical protein